MTRGLLLLLVVLLAACSRSTEPRVINGAGATLPYPLYSKWFVEYARVDPTTRINYQALGSGAGIRQMSDGVVDFGATDEPMPEARDGKHAFIHVPTTIGAVAITYNLPGNSTELRLTPDLIADLFLGVVTRWDDPRLAAINPGVMLPAEGISIVHRADGSGTSAAFTAYLSQNSEVWRARVGSGTAPRFPVGVGAKGNDGATLYVKETPSSLGYVELAYARQAKLPVALVKNRAGGFVAPTIEALGHAAEGGRTSIVDSPHEGAYPIAAVSFVLLPQNPTDRVKAAALARFLWWGIHEGQAHAPSLDYAPLSPALVARSEEALRPLLPPEGS